MQVDEILSKIQFVVNPETGKKSAVLIDYAVWEELLILLEDREDLEETSARLGSDNKPLRPFGLCAGEFTVPDNFDDPLPPLVPTESLA